MASASILYCQTKVIEDCITADYVKPPKEGIPSLLYSPYLVPLNFIRNGYFRLPGSCILTVFFNASLPSIPRSSNIIFPFIPQILSVERFFF